MKIEEEARDIVDGARRQSYGSPKDNHWRTAVLWGAYLEAKYQGRQEQYIPDDVDVCYLNILQKMARNMHDHNRENLVDHIGYVLNIDILMEGE